MREYQDLALEIVRRRDGTDTGDATEWKRRFADRLARLPPVGRTTKLPDQLARRQRRGPLFQAPAAIQQQLLALVNDKESKL
tara:strand:- start:82 stop:327 length:246 start_codon:yes stop_codon:yes gene_type:complete